MTMTCTECLRLVATADVAELATADAVRAHCRSCPDCATLVAAVGDETRRLAELLDGTPPGVPSHVVALQAIAEGSRGRRRGRRVGGALTAGAVLLSVLGGFALLRSTSDVGLVERTVALRCLSAAHVTELARPNLPAGVLVSLRPGEAVPVLSLRGSRHDVEAAQRLLVSLDLDAASPGEGGAACTAPRR